MALAVAEATGIKGGVEHADIGGQAGECDLADTEAAKDRIESDGRSPVAFKEAGIGIGLSAGASLGSARHARGPR